MKYLLDGLRAATIATLVLTLWSFLGVAEAMDAETEQAGVLFVASAFGILGLPQLLYGLGLGALVGAWVAFAESEAGKALRTGLENPAADRTLAAAILYVPIASVIVGGAVGATHLFVTAGFVRASFQALGLTLVTTVFMIALVACFPIFRTIVLKVPLFRGGKAKATTTTLIILAGLVLVLIVGGYAYASSLNIWSTRLLHMMVFAAVFLPVAMSLMGKVKADNGTWRVGVPAAGSLLIVVLFFFSASWTSSSAAMREATTKHSALVAFEAKFLQRFVDRDGDGYPRGFGGSDCDDDNDKIFPGARDIPGNEVDESCSGADAELPSGKDHVSRKLIAGAIDTGQAAANKSAQDIPDPPKNLVVLLVDTLRADHVGFLGYSRNTSPHMDALAKESVVFSNAYATSPHTPRSIPAIFTGRYPSRTAWRGGQYNYPKVKPENTTFFEVLKDAGHYNVGMSSHHYFQEKRGLGQGFDLWNNDGFQTIAESNDDIASPRIWNKVEPLIEELGKKASAQDATPFSLFVHLFEPHARWISHKEYPFDPGSTQESRHQAAYDSEIAFTDAYIGKIVAKLKASGLYENTVIVLVSDHGEGFNEHGYFFHGQNLYNEVIKVPLLIRVPGWRARMVDSPVSIVDVGPTVVDLFGYTKPDDFDGASLMPLMLGETASRRPIFAELLPYTSWKEHHKAVIDGDLKYTSILTSGTKELYDLKEDPAETKNLVNERPEDAKRLDEILQQFMNQ